MTSCRGANPTSPFGLRIADTTPTRTDSYNNLYATPTPNPFFFDGFYTLDLLPAAQGPLFNVDCLGRLVVPAPGGGETLYAAVESLSTDFGIVYFLSVASPPCPPRSTTAALANARPQLLRRHREARIRLPDVRIRGRVRRLPRPESRAGARFDPVPDVSAVRGVL